MSTELLVGTGGCPRELSTVIMGVEFAARTANSTLTDRKVTGDVRQWLPRDGNRRERRIAVDGFCAERIGGELKRTMRERNSAELEQ